MLSIGHGTCFTDSVISWSGVIEGHAGVLASDKFCHLLSPSVIGSSQIDASHSPSFINQVELTGRSDEMQSRLTE